MSDETEILTPEELVAVRKRMDESFLKDPERWRISYMEHNATALHRRAVAPTNGRAK